MKVYVVTSGYYSDYQIEAVFTNETMANQYANMDSDRQVEVYEADSVKIATAPMKAKIWYDPEANEITSIRIDDYVQDRLRPDPDRFEYGELVAYRKLSARTLKDIQEHGKKSPLLLKAMQDAWGMYKYEHGVEAEEDESKYLTSVNPEEGSKMFKAFANVYNILFASTSSAIGDDGNEQDELR